MPGYDMRGGIDEKFRGLSAIGGGSVPVGVLRGAWMDKYFWVGARRLMLFETTRIRNQHIERATNSGHVYP